MDQKNDSFQYTYSASQQAEVDRIRKKYLPKEEDKMEQLRRMDRNAAKPGMIISLTVGIISALIMGVGMCCTMVWGDTLFVPGIIIGIIGIAGICSAYPLYSRITKKRREKLAPDILRLADELKK